MQVVLDLNEQVAARRMAGSPYTPVMTALPLDYDMIVCGSAAEDSDSVKRTLCKSAFSDFTVSCASVYWNSLIRWKRVVQSPGTAPTRGNCFASFGHDWLKIGPPYLLLIMVWVLTCPFLKSDP